MHPEAQLAEFATELSYDDLPGSAVETVTRAVTDTVGVTLAGTGAEAGAAAASAAGVDATDPATLLGVGTDEPPEAAALRVGTAAHALDYDDLSWAMDGHPSVALVPPLLALAAEADAGGRDLIAAYAAGFEAACAVAGPVSPDHYEAGWHATATFGTLGAAVAAAHLLGLDRERTRHALCAAASMPAGLKRNFGSMTKPLHAGLCARSGVTAARLAREGLTADPRAVGGDRGFWDLYGPAERGGFSVGDRWRIEEEGIHVKAYPCCYFTHAAIAAAQAIDVAPGAVERVTVEVSQGAVDACQHADPETGLEGKFSVEYCVASALVRERVGPETFTAAAIADPDVQRVRERVDVRVDDGLAYDAHAGRVLVETDGGSRERRRDHPPGTHDDPLPEAEFRAKFEACAGRVLEEPGRLYDLFSALPACPDLPAALAGE